MSKSAASLNTYPPSNPLGAMLPSLARRIRKDNPDLNDHSTLTHEELAGYRLKLVSEMLQAEHGELTQLDDAVARSLAHSESIVSNTDDNYEGQRTFGERLSDQIAGFGGSWAFLISFGLVLVAWIALNLVQGQSKAFDPFPFILLNLLLSCLAAVQAPLIMMSQRRQEEKDRMRARNDYQINLKAELEIRHLHEKIDHLLNSQWQRLAHLQEVQIEMLDEIRKQRPATARVKK
jgi:uncharacterized membrane protein